MESKIEQLSVSTPERVEIKKEHIDELYKRLITSQPLQVAFLGSRFDKLNSRKRKKELVKAFFSETVYDQQVTKASLEAIVRLQMLDLEMSSLDIKNKGVLNLGVEMPIFDEFLRIAYDCDVISLDDFPSDQNTSFPGAADRYVYGDARMLPFKDEAFDVIISHAAVPHIFVQPREEGESDIDLLKEDYDISIIVDEVLMALEESYRCLKPGGQIRFSALSRNIELDEVDIHKPGLSKEIRSKIINKKVDILEKGIQFFEHKNHCLVLYKSTTSGVLIIKKPGN